MVRLIRTKDFLVRVRPSRQRIKGNNLRLPHRLRFDLDPGHEVYRDAPSFFGRMLSGPLYQLLFWHGSMSGVLHIGDSGVLFCTGARDKNALVSTYRNDLRQAVHILETERSIGGGNVAGFLQQHQGLPRHHFKHFANGLTFSSDFPLIYSLTDSMLRSVLVERRERYGWRDEIHRVTRNMDSWAIYSPSRN